MSAKRKTFLILFLLLSIGALGLILWGNYQVFRQVSQEEGKQIEQYWASGELKAIIELAQEKLKQDSLNFQMLRYCGYAYFYLALGQIDEAERNRNLRAAIRYLRKSLVTGYHNQKVLGEIHYLLGKAYYYSGLSAMPLAVRFLQRSIEEGYKANDSYEFLAEGYQKLGQEEKSLDYFAKLDKPGAPDRFLLAYGKSLLSSGKSSQAEQILQRARKNSQNQLLIADILLQLAQVYYNEGRWSEDQKLLEQALEKQESADAHFLLGEVYHALKQPVQARKEWRATIKLDKQYEAAYRRLQE